MDADGDGYPNSRDRFPNDATYFDHGPDYVEPGTASHGVRIPLGHAQPSLPMPSRLPTPPPSPKTPNYQNP